jgi:hypothetical protein
MAINRTDTPLANTSEPKAIDPVITKTTDPDTGAVTTRKVWTNSYGNRTNSGTTKRTTPLIKSNKSASSVKKPASSSGKKVVERSWTEVNMLGKPKGTTVNTKPSAPIATIRQTPTKADRYRAVWNKSYETRKDKSQTFDQWDQSEKERTQKNAAKNRRWDWLKGDGGNGEMDKNKSGGCTRC